MSSARNAGSALSGRYSPLRYPGGKGKLARFVAAIARMNGLVDGLYVEPFAGGAGVAWELLLTGVVRRVAVNDLSRPVFAFWSSVLDRTDDLIRLIAETPVDLANWDRAKRTFSNPNDADDLELGFATFFLNRTNRSGILNGGPIGGRDQSGTWKMGARYNKDDLISRIERIALARRRIVLTNLDATEFLGRYWSSWNTKTLIYLDPPYFTKGPDLYYNFYKQEDHVRLASAVRALQRLSWIVSYDDVEPIHALYSGLPWLRYGIGYSARRFRQGREAMFFSPGLRIPGVSGSMVEVDRWPSESVSGPFRGPEVEGAPLAAATHEQSLKTARSASADEDQTFVEAVADSREE